jgi:hypothetical protein
VTVLLRFADLKARNIVRNWPSLKRLIQDQGFPSGIKLGSNTRAWVESDIEEWIANRPTGGTPQKRLAE